MRLIDEDAANVDSISCFYGDRAYLDDVQEWLDEQPTIDHVKHGRWESYANEEDKGFHYCSECGRQAFNYLEDEIIEEVLSNYCPHAARRWIWR